MEANITSSIPKESLHEFMATSIDLLPDGWWALYIADFDPRSFACEPVDSGSCWVRPARSVLREVV